MEKPGGPRIYVPVSLPDGNGNHSINGFINNNNSHNNNNHNNNNHNNPSSNMGRTYAVLEFKGFSGGPMSSPAQISSPVLPFPGTAGDSLLQRMLVPRGLPLSGAGGGGGGTFSITHHLKPDALLPAEGSGGSGFHMVWPGGGGSVISGSGNGSSGVNFLTATAAWDSPSPSPSPTAASCQALDQNTAAATVAAGVSISHTDRDTIVHTDSSNFRDVVHQLTGASKDEATLPVTLPARSAARAAAAAASSAGQDPLPPTSATLAPRRQPTKLHERRKALRNLEKLTTGTSSKELVPSPVTPLASDFDKICNFLSAPTTPSPRGSAVSSATRRSPPSPLPLPLSAAVALPLAALGPLPPPTSSSSTSSSSSISSPRLLSLFPESPVCSPKSFPR